MPNYSYRSGPIIHSIVTNPVTAIKSINSILITYHTYTKIPFVKMRLESINFMQFTDNMPI